MADRRTILAIIGPTASGKSALALAVAEKAKAELLSVDSMQVYRGMDIGTAKPTPAERARVRHHLIDEVGPDETFTVARFVERAEQVIADAAARRVPLVAAGGTPLYFKALFEGLFEGPPGNESIRARLRGLSGEALHARLREVDPEAASRIHPNDTKRLIRALEVFEQTGRPISRWQTEWSSGVTRHPVTWVGLNRDREALNRRINARAKQMIGSGWLEEARQLRDTFGELSKTAQEAAGYRFLFEHLAGRMTLEEAIEQIKISTRQLARRQIKWFRRFAGVLWLPGDAPVEQNVERVLEAWQ
jgi:tRNA dimethylallyltransferase